MFYSGEDFKTNPQSDFVDTNCQEDCKADEQLDCLGEDFQEECESEEQFGETKPLIDDSMVSVDGSETLVSIKLEIKQEIEFE